MPVRIAWRAVFNARSSKVREGLARKGERNANIDAAKENDAQPKSLAAWAGCPPDCAIQGLVLLNPKSDSAKWLTHDVDSFSAAILLPNEMERDSVTERDGGGECTNKARMPSVHGRGGTRLAWRLPANTCDHRDLGCEAQISRPGGRAESAE